MSVTRYHTAYPGSMFAHEPGSYADEYVLASDYDALAEQNVELEAEITRLCKLTSPKIEARLAEAERDAARLNHLEGMTRFYGDGYTEPREWSVGIDWQQTRLDEGIPSLRDVIDAAMRETER